MFELVLSLEEVGVRWEWLSAGGFLTLCTRHLKQVSSIQESRYSFFPSLVLFSRGSRYCSAPLSLLDITTLYYIRNVLGHYTCYGRSLQGPNFITFLGIRYKVVFCL